VHTAHYYPVEEAFAEPLAVDGEQYRLDETGVTRLDTGSEPAGGEATHSEPTSD